MAGRTRMRRTTTAKTKARRRKPAPQGRRSSERLGKSAGMKRYDSALDRPKRVKPGAGLLFRLGMKPYQASGSVLLLLLIALLTFFFQSPNFYVWRLSVTGTEWLDPEHVRRMSGLDGLSIFYVNPDQVADVVLNLPSVKRVGVRCQLPSSVAIYVTERVPLAIWQNQGVQYWVDESGMLFERFADMADPVVIVEQDDITRRPGELVDTRVLNKVLELHTLLPEVSAFGYSRADGLLFKMANNRQVWAKVDCDAVKVVSALVAVEDDLAARQLSPGVVDLRFGTRAFWR